MAQSVGTAASAVQPPPQPPPQLFSVDAEGTGAGRIVSETGDVYEGSFLRWQRDGWGLQRWSTGESFRGVWVGDAQARGVFTDAQGTRWKGDFRNGQVRRVEEGQREGSLERDALDDDDVATALREEEDEDAAAGRRPQHSLSADQQQQQQHRVPDEQKEESTHVTHFPPTHAYAYQHQYAPGGTQDLSRTQPQSFAQTQQFSTPFAHTQQLPPQSARSHRSSASSVASGSSSARAGRRKPSHPRTAPRRPIVRESASERAEREAREKREEEIVAKELSAARYMIANRYGSNRMPFEAPGGSADSPGPGAYASVLTLRRIPSLSQVKRSPPSHSMAPLLPYSSHVFQLVKSTAHSAGPWSYGGECGVTQPLPLGKGDPSRPAAPHFSMTRPTMLPQYVKESSFFRAPVPGPGSYDTIVTPRGTANSVSASSSGGGSANLVAAAAAACGAPPPPLGGSAIKGRPIPLFLGHEAQRHENLGRGPAAGEYTPRIDGLSDRPRGPQHSMGGRFKVEQYAAARRALLPAPGAYSPSLSATRASAADAAPAFGRSRAGQRVHPTESIRAIAYPGDERLLRNQLGLASPGPVAYSPAIVGSMRPSPVISSFEPHIVQPQAVRLAKQYVASGHPFVAKFQKQRAKERQAAEALGGDGEDDQQAEQHTEES